MFIKSGPLIDEFTEEQFCVTGVLFNISLDT